MQEATLNPLHYKTFFSHFFDFFKYAISHHVLLSGHCCPSHRSTFFWNTFVLNGSVDEFWLTLERNCENQNIITCFLDYALDDHVAQSFDFYPEDWCLARCNLNQRCRSVNFKRDISSTPRNCELNSATRQKRPRSYNPRPGWVYFENKVDTPIWTKVTIPKGHHSNILMTGEGGGEGLDRISYFMPGPKKS